MVLCLDFSFYHKKRFLIPSFQLLTSRSHSLHDPIIFLHLFKLFFLLIFSKVQTLFQWCHTNEILHLYKILFDILCFFPPNTTGLFVCVYWWGWGGNDMIYLRAEFLPKLSHEPDMNLSEGFSQSERHVDDNSLPVPRNINLTAAMQTKEPSIHTLCEDHMVLSKHDLVDNSYTAEFMNRSFRSLFSSWLVFSKSNKACTDSTGESQSSQL